MAQREKTPRVIIVDEKFYENRASPAATGRGKLFQLFLHISSLIRAPARRIRRLAEKEGMGE